MVYFLVSSPEFEKLMKSPVLLSQKREHGRPICRSCLGALTLQGAAWGLGQRLGETCQSSWSGEGSSLCVGGVSPTGPQPGPAAVVTAAATRGLTPDPSSAGPASSCASPRPCLGRTRPGRPGLRSLGCRPRLCHLPALLSVRPFCASSATSPGVLLGTEGAQRLAVTLWGNMNGTRVAVRAS